MHDKLDVYLCIYVVLWICDVHVCDALNLWCVYMCCVNILWCVWPGGYQILSGFRMQLECCAMSLCNCRWSCFFFWGLVGLFYLICCLCQMIELVITMIIYGWLTTNVGNHLILSVNQALQSLTMIIIVFFPNMG